MGRNAIKRFLTIAPVLAGISIIVSALSGEDDGAHHIRLVRQANLKPRLSMNTDPRTAPARA